MPNADISLCRVVFLLILSGVVLVSIRIIRDIIIERRPTKRTIHTLKPRRIPMDKSRNPTIAIEMNTDMVERMTSLISSCEYWFDCLTW